MFEFRYEKAKDSASALRLFARGPHARYLGGGTNLVDLMRENIERPQTLVDVSSLLSTIDARGDGSVLIGAAVKNTAVAEHAQIRQRFPVLARAILSGASGQIRNMATVGGNLLQRTRCQYFNPKTASSQFRGGIIMGLGLALTEETLFDERNGRIMNPSLAEYHVPVHLDVPEIEVMWNDIPDPHSPLGARGIGEIGITGVGAAVSNAIYNATGARIRDLPITLDKLLAHEFIPNEGPSRPIKCRNVGH